MALFKVTRKIGKEKIDLIIEADYPGQASWMADELFYAIRHERKLVPSNSPAPEKWTKMIVDANGMRKGVRFAEKKDYTFVK